MYLYVSCVYMSYVNATRQTFHHSRWPWPLFQLLHGSMTLASESKKTIAKRLLAEDDTTLEATTSRIKSLCKTDLQFVASFGMLQKGSLLHGVLVAAARDLRIDAGELESLNSMIKSILFVPDRQGNILVLMCVCVCVVPVVPNWRKRCL